MLERVFARVIKFVIVELHGIRFCKVAMTGFDDTYLIILGLSPLCLILSRFLFCR
jgi:hypothetical protein